jgi:hypothetical protein
MNTEQIKDTIRTIGKMTYAETVNNQNRILQQGVWEIALQLSMLHDQAEKMLEKLRTQALEIAKKLERQP